MAVGAIVSVALATRNLGVVPFDSPEESMATICVGIAGGLVGAVVGGVALSGRPVRQLRFARFTASLLAVSITTSVVCGLIGTQPDSTGIRSFTSVVLWIGVHAITISVLARWAVMAEYGPGHCAACGYPVRGISRDRCPECGNFIGR